MIVKVPVEEPIATVKEVATDADVDDDVTVTVTALFFGTALSVTVPVEEAPPINVEGESESAVIANGVKDNVVVLEVPLDVAVIVVDVLAVTTR